MIECSDKVFRLATAHTAYLFRVTDFGHLEHLHYGGVVPMADGAALGVKTTIARKFEDESGKEQRSVILSAYDVLDCRKFIIDEAALKVVEEVYA